MSGRCSRIRILILGYPDVITSFPSVAPITLVVFFPFVASFLLIASFPFVTSFPLVASFRSLYLFRSLHPFH